MALFDVTNPALPVYLSEILSPVWSYNSQAHDAVVKNGRVTPRGSVAASPCMT